MNLSLDDTKKKLDKALKRNLGEQPKTAPTSAKSAEPDLTAEENISDTEEVPIDV